MTDLLMFLLAIQLFEKKSDKNEYSADCLSDCNRISKDNHRTKNGKEFSCRCKDRASQRAKPFDS